jgi:hypothetical protein
MKVYKGIVKRNTVILEEKPNLPDECRAGGDQAARSGPRQGNLAPVDRTSAQGASRRQAALQEARGDLRPMRCG